jgi:hypothetical protein
MIIIMNYPPAPVGLPPCPPKGGFLNSRGEEKSRLLGGLGGCLMREAQISPNLNLSFALIPLGVISRLQHSICSSC